MILVQSIIDRTTDLLVDKDRSADGARWSDDELIRWINDSRAAIVTRRPAACPKVTVVTLAEGSFQAVPDDGVQLLDVIRNMGTTGTTPGRSIRRTDRQNIDDLDSYWHAGASKTEISQFSFDDRIPNNYFVYPPAKAGTKVQIAYSAIPAPVSKLTDQLDLYDYFIEAVVNYVAYRAKSKDSEYANAAEAAAFYGAFNDALGAQAQSQSNTSPNQPGNSV